MEEKAAAKAGSLLAAVFAGIQDGLAVLDETLTIIRVNPTMAAWYAHALPLEGRKCYEAFRNHAQPCTECPSLQVLQTGETVTAVVPKINKNGEISGWLELYCFPLKDMATGEITGVIENFRDITARLQGEEALQRAKEELEQGVEERTADLKIANKNLQLEIEERTRAEEALRATEMQFRTLVEQSLVGIYILQDDVFRYVNPSLAKMFAYRQEELTDRSPMDLVVPEDRPLVAENIRRRLAGEIASLCYTFRGRKKDGAPVNVEVHTTPTEFQGRPAIMGTLRDITQITRAQEALGHRDAILEAVSFAAASIIRDADWQKNIAEVLHRLGQAAGMSLVNVFENYRDESGALRTRLSNEWISPDITPRANNPLIADFSWKDFGLDEWAAKLAQGLPVCGRLRKWSRMISIIDVPIFVEGNWWGVIGFEDHLVEREWSGEEIEALKAAAGIIGGAIQRDQTQKALQRQENLLKTIFRTIPDLIILKDRDLVYRAVNPAFCRFLGKNEDDILGKKDQDLFSGAEAEIYRSNDLQVMASGRPLLRDEEVTGGNGKQWLQVLKTPVSDEEGATAGILCSFRDISARKKAEETLRNYRAKLQKIIAERAPGVDDPL